MPKSLAFRRLKALKKTAVVPVSGKARRLIHPFIHSCCKLTRGYMQSLHSPDRSHERRGLLPPRAPRADVEDPSPEALLGGLSKLEGLPRAPALLLSVLPAPARQRGGGSDRYHDGESRALRRRRREEGVD